MQTLQFSQDNPFRKLQEKQLRMVIEYLHLLDSDDLDLDNPEVFAAMLVSATEICGFTQLELAEMIDVPVANLSRWARSKTTPAKYARGSILVNLRRALRKFVKENKLEAA